jgi:erythromycin esterase
MKKIILLLLFLSFYSCKAQSDFTSEIVVTSNLEKFETLSELKKKLKDVEIIALGENTQGLGEVFKAKTELVKFLHQELGFNVVIFESGYGDAALAWEKLDSLSAKDFTLSFTSNFYYQNEAIKELVEYTKSQNNKPLMIQGFDCQVQQNYLSKRMAAIFHPIDSVYSNSVSSEMKSFLPLYQYEQDNDSVSFYKQRDYFIDFITNYEIKLNEFEKELVKNGTTSNEIKIVKKCIQMFKSTYATLKIGELMGWPIAANTRDKAMFENVKWFKEENPNLKIILWAQNSHLENKPNQNETVNWMGHQLKAMYGKKYYSIGTFVYSGTSMTYNDSFTFEHNKPTYLAYHLNQFNKDKFVLDLRSHHKIDFTNQLLLGIDTNGYTSEFIVKDRFDGLLFIKHSGMPKLITNP